MWMQGINVSMVLDARFWDYFSLYIWNEVDKEWFSILLLSEKTYALWENILLKWENGNVLNEIDHLPTWRITWIGKSNFNYLTKFCESQLAARGQGLLDHKYMLREILAKFEGGRNLKSMLELWWD
jgi:hypothetical protein